MSNVFIFQNKLSVFFRGRRSQGHRIPVEVPRVQTPKTLYQIKAYRAGYQTKTRILKYN